MSTPTPPPPTERTETTLAPELAERFARVDSELAELHAKVDQLLSLAHAYADEQQAFRARLDAVEETLQNHGARLVRLEPLPPLPAAGNDGR